jgi:regulator of replication initiation timing
MQIMTKELQLKGEIRILTGQLSASYGNIKRLVEENKRLTEEIRDLKFTTAQEYMEDQEITVSDLEHLRDP